LTLIMEKSRRRIESAKVRPLCVIMQAGVSEELWVDGNRVV
jgi:hypothetical protein